MSGGQRKVYLNLKLLQKESEGHSLYSSGSPQLRSEVDILCSSPSASLLNMQNNIILEDNDEEYLICHPRNNSQQKQSHFRMPCKEISKNHTQDEENRTRANSTVKLQTDREERNFSKYSNGYFLPKTVSLCTKIYKKIIIETPQEQAYHALGVSKNPIASNKNQKNPFSNNVLANFFQSNMSVKTPEQMNPSFKLDHKYIQNANSLKNKSPDHDTALAQYFNGRTARTLDGNAPVSLRSLRKHLATLQKKKKEKESSIEMPEIMISETEEKQLMDIYQQSLINYHYDSSEELKEDELKLAIDIQQSDSKGKNMRENSQELTQCSTPSRPLEEYRTYQGKSNSSLLHKADKQHEGEERRIQIQKEYKVDFSRNQGVKNSIKQYMDDIQRVKADQKLLLERLLPVPIKNTFYLEKNNVSPRYIGAVRRNRNVTPQNYNHIEQLKSHEEQDNTDSQFMKLLSTNIIGDTNDSSSKFFVQKSFFVRKIRNSNSTRIIQKKNYQHSPTPIQNQTWCDVFRPSSSKINNSLVLSNRLQIPSNGTFK